MCQEHCHFDVQVARRQGGAGLPSAVRLALAALPTHWPGAAGLRGSLGVAPQSCAGKYLGSWGRQSPEQGAGPGSDPGPALGSSHSIGLKVTPTARQDSLVPAPGQCADHGCFD